MSPVDPAVHAIAMKQAEMAQDIADLFVAIKSLESEKAKGYKPKPSVRWWDNLPDDEVRAYLGPLRGWYEQVAMPVLGAPELPPCVYVHGLCRTVLCTSSELWKSMWLPQRRTPQLVAAQAEWLVRLWPGLLEILVRETTRCSHQNANVRLAGGDR
jgi:hypothetical protein